MFLNQIFLARIDSIGRCWSDRFWKKALGKKQFKIISDDIKDDYGVENIHTLGNLALLDKSFNSYLNNGFFDSKREKIIEEEKKGKFYIPICTKNVFLKFYNINTLRNC